MLRIVIAGPDEALSVWLADALAPAQEFEVVGTTRDGESTLSTVRRTCPDVVVVDVDAEMPPPGGSTLVAAIVDAIPDVVVVVLATDPLGENAHAALAAGAAAVLAKDGSAQIPTRPHSPDSGKSRPTRSTSCERHRWRDVHGAADAVRAVAFASRSIAPVARRHSLLMRTWSPVVCPGRAPRWA
jgi:DNA-binding NarL/FixJ family response regulator